MKTPFVLIGWVLFLSWVPHVLAADNTCWLEAPVQDDVWVIVYDADADGNRGPILWKGKISAGAKIKVTSTDGHIRFDTKRAEDQPYEGDVSVGCFGQRSVSVE